MKALSQQSGTFFLQQNLIIFETLGFILTRNDQKITCTKYMLWVKLASQTNQNCTSGKISVTIQ